MRRNDEGAGMNKDTERLLYIGLHLENDPVPSTLSALELQRICRAPNSRALIDRSRALPPWSSLSSFFASAPLE